MRSFDGKRLTDMPELRARPAGIAILSWLAFSIWAAVEVLIERQHARLALPVRAQATLQVSELPGAPASCTDL